MTAEPSVSPAGALASAAPAAPPTRDPDQIVAAVGALLGWESASFLVALRGEDGPTVRQAWRSTASVPTPEVVPLQVGELDASAWQDQRFAWLPAVNSETAAPSHLVLPVRSGSDLAGVLVYSGRSLRQPVAAELPLLEAVAALLGAGGTAADDEGHVAVSPSSPVERTMALVDVFAFTVRVTEDGSLEWLYFGPNSAAVFGSSLAADVGLVELVERRAHPDDRHRVHRLARAAAEGRPLDVEIRILGGDGVTRWVSWRMVPRRAEGQLHVDGVATDVSSRHSLGRSRRELAEATEQYEREVDLRRRHALAVRDANDNVLQRLFAAGLRLQILKRRLNEVEAHAASAIAFQLDQAATDLREVIKDLNGVIGEVPEALAEAAG